MSGFLSLQCAIDGYALALSAGNETSVGTSRDGLYTAWAAAFPTAAYDHNEFYVGP